MPVRIRRGVSWTRKHDDPRTPLKPRVDIAYPTSLEELIELCEKRPAGQKLRAAGSHYALSEAAISDNLFVETHDPNLDQTEPDYNQAMGKTLTNVIPACLTADFLLKFSQDDNYPYVIHVESGKRIHQLYAELDQPKDASDRRTLAGVMKLDYGVPQFASRHALSTMGSAARQTVVGAFSTGTHGGDFDRPPLSDAVMALHLVVDGGKHYWIEPSPTEQNPQLTDDNKLQLVYGSVGAPNSFEIIREDDVFNGVLVSAGRFGIIYSVVLKARQQYQLHESRVIRDWQEISHLIANPASTS